MTVSFNRFGDSAERRKALIVSGARWVQVIYTSGQGTPQRRSILALAGETAAEAAADILNAPDMEGETILAAGEAEEKLANPWHA
jgi:hypothetical protein